MNKLLTEIEKLKKTNIGKEVRKRLLEFSQFNNKSFQEWFSELCFCILTANSKAKTAIAIQEELGYKGFSSYPEKQIATIIKNKGHRFHNNKAKFIIQARKHLDIKHTIQSFKTSFEAREWLVENIKGINYKESSHFLRNTGYFDLAVLDRHIINLMLEHGYLKEKPKNLNKKNYLIIEQKFLTIAKQINMSIAELDLYMWFLKTGEVLR